MNAKTSSADRGEAGDAQHGTGAARRRRLGLPRPPQERSTGAEQQTRCDRVNVDRYKKLVRSDVQRRGCRQEPGEHHHCCGGAQDRIAQPCARRRLRRVEQHERDRPQQVPLLLDRQAPQVANSGEKLPKYCAPPKI